MKGTSFSKKRTIHVFVLIFILVMIILIASLLMFKYHVEGETNLPFELKKINVISTAESSITQDEENTWRADILQRNDIFFVIEKNSEYKKDELIKKVSFENFEVTKTNNNMVVEIYKPTTTVNTYNYSEEYKTQKLEYVGGQSTNTETLQINNQGGLIGFSIVSNNLGEYMFSESEKLPSDGRLLEKTGIKAEDMNFKITFDLIIETESNHKFKANITLDLPTGNILQDGVGTLEDTELENVVFKRF